MEELTLDAQVQGKAEDRHGVDVEGDQETQHVGGTHDTNGPYVEGALIQEMVVVEGCLLNHLLGLGRSQELIAQVLKIARREDGVGVTTGGRGAAQIQITILLQGLWTSTRH